MPPESIYTLRTEKLKPQKMFIKHFFFLNPQIFSPPFNQNIVGQVQTRVPLSHQRKKKESSLVFAKVPLFSIEVNRDHQKKSNKKADGDELSRTPLPTPVRVECPECDAGDRVRFLR